MILTIRKLISNTRNLSSKFTKVRNSGLIFLANVTEAKVTRKNETFAPNKVTKGMIFRLTDPGVSINGLSDSFLLTCGGIESVTWHPKIVRRRLFGPSKTGLH